MCQTEENRRMLAWVVPGYILLAWFFCVLFQPSGVTRTSDDRSHPMFESHDSGGGGSNNFIDRLHNIEHVDVRSKPEDANINSSSTESVVGDEEIFGVNFIDVKEYFNEHCHHNHSEVNVSKYGDSQFESTDTSNGNSIVILKFSSSTFHSTIQSTNPSTTCKPSLMFQKHVSSDVMDHERTNKMDGIMMSVINFPTPTSHLRGQPNSNNCLYTVDFLTNGGSRSKSGKCSKQKSFCIDDEYRYHQSRMFKKTQIVSKMSYNVFNECPPPPHASKKQRLLHQLIISNGISRHEKSVRITDLEIVITPNPNLFYLKKKVSEKEEEGELEAKRHYGERRGDAKYIVMASYKIPKVVRKVNNSSSLSSHSTSDSEVDVKCETGYELVKCAENESKAYSSFTKATSYNSQAAQIYSKLICMNATAFHDFQNTFIRYWFEKTRCEVVSSKNDDGSSTSRSSPTPFWNMWDEQQQQPTIPSSFDVISAGDGTSVDSNDVRSRFQSDRWWSMSTMSVMIGSYLIVLSFIVCMSAAFNKWQRLVSWSRRRRSPHTTTSGGTTRTQPNDGSSPLVLFWPSFLSQQRRAAAAAARETTLPTENPITTSAPVYGMPPNYTESTGNERSSQQAPQFTGQIQRPPTTGSNVEGIIAQNLEPRRGALSIMVMYTSESSPVSANSAQQNVETMENLQTETTNVNQQGTLKHVIWPAGGGVGTSGSKAYSIYEAPPTYESLFSAASNVDTGGGGGINDSSPDSTVDSPSSVSGDQPKDNESPTGGAQDDDSTTTRRLHAIVEEPIVPVAVVMEGDEPSIGAQNAATGAELDSVDGGETQL